jgi:2-keto-4-pentenoate hydratase/2-oxohepta-3-ene-1,7-dioic acid hydratase in catechol pathway
MMHYEGELVVVVGRTASRVRRSEAMDFVLGYTIANDYAVRDSEADFEQRFRGAEGGFHCCLEAVTNDKHS